MERTQRQREQLVQLEEERLAAKREAYLRRVNPTRQLSAAEHELTVRYRRRKIWLHVVAFAAVSHRWHEQLIQIKHLIAMAKAEGIAASIIQHIWRKWKWQHASKHTVVVYTWLRKCMWKLLLRIRCRRRTRHASLLQHFMLDHVTASHAKKNFNRVMILWRGKIIRAQKAGMYVCFLKYWRGKHVEKKYANATVCICSLVGPSSTAIGLECKRCQCGGIMLITNANARTANKLISTMDGA